LLLALQALDSNNKPPSSCCKGTTALLLLVVAAAVCMQASNHNNLLGKRGTARIGHLAASTNAGWSEPPAQIQA
jgi:hypothetical protein